MFHQPKYVQTPNECDLAESGKVLLPEKMYFYYNLNILDNKSHHRKSPGFRYDKMYHKGCCLQPSQENWRLLCCPDKYHIPRLSEQVHQILYALYKEPMVLQTQRWLRRRRHRLQHTYILQYYLCL